MQRNSSLAGRDAALAALLPAVLSVAFAARRLPHLLAGGLIDPDSFMRLVRLREMLQVHHRVDIVWNDSSGGGTLLHWSHLLDSLLAVLSLPFRLGMDLSPALHAAALLVGPLCMASLGLAVCWAVTPFASPRYRWLAALLAALSPLISSYGLVGVVHHHVPVLIAAVMAAGWAARLIAGLAPASAGIALGAWAGLGMWLTPESVPLTMMSFGAVWLVWATDPRRADMAAAMRRTGAAFLLTVTAAWLVDPPHRGYAAFAVDRLSLVFVGVAAVVAVVAAATMPLDRLARSRRLRPTTRLALAAGVGIACSLIWLAAFPALLRGSATLISPADWRLMFSGIAEMRPITTAHDALCDLLGGTLALILLAWLARRHRSLPLAYAALCTALLLLAAQHHERFAVYPAAVAAVLLPVAIDTLERCVPSAFEVRRMLARVATVIAFLLLPYAGGLLAPAQAADQAADSCTTDALPAMLAAYRGKVVLADVNLTPELLFRTPVRTVGSLYHRNPAAFLRLRAAWRSMPDRREPEPDRREPEAVRRTKASLVLVCPRAGRSPLVAGLPKRTLLDRLRQHRAPPWLRSIAHDPVSGFTLYRVTHP